MVGGDAAEDEGWRSKCHDALRAALEAVQGAPMGEPDEEGQTGGLTAKLTAGDRLLYCNLLPILPVALFGALFQVQHPPPSARREKRELGRYRGSHKQVMSLSSRYD